MTFSEALEHCKNGASIARSGWNGKGMHVAMQEPTPQSKMTLPYLYMQTAQGDLVPWLVSQTDLLSDDWTLVL